MTPNENIPDSVRGTLDSIREEKKGYGLVGRIIIFVVAGGLFSALCAYFFVRFAIGAAMTAGASGGPAPLFPILFVWGFGIAVIAYLNFKK
jgi:hypothetical protein